MSVVTTLLAALTMAAPPPPSDALSFSPVDSGVVFPATLDSEPLLGRSVDPYKKPFAFGAQYESPDSRTKLFLFRGFLPSVGLWLNRANSLATSYSKRPDVKFNGMKKLELEAGKPIGGILSYSFKGRSDPSSNVQDYARATAIVQTGSWLLLASTHSTKAGIETVESDLIRKIKALNLPPPEGAIYFDVPADCPSGLKVEEVGKLRSPRRSEREAASAVIDGVRAARIAGSIEILQNPSLWCRVPHPDYEFAQSVYRSIDAQPGKWVIVAGNVGTVVMNICEQGTPACTLLLSDAYYAEVRGVSDAPVSPEAGASRSLHVYSPGADELRAK